MECKEGAYRVKERKGCGEPMHWDWVTVLVGGTCRDRHGQRKVQACADRDTGDGNKGAGMEVRAAGSKRYVLG
jgi:hypothetical protein